MQSKKYGIMLVAAVAMVLISALAASAAQAAGGPLWVVGAGAEPLAEGHTRALVSKSEGALTLHSGVASIVCESATNTGFLLGGNPGTDYAKIIFKECHVEGKPNCTATGLKPLAAANEGEIVVDVLTVLVYPKSGAEKESALDAFAPEGETANPNLFVAFEIRNKTGFTECGLILNKIQVKVEAKGTPIKIKSEERNCGQLAQVGHEEGGSFVLSKPNLTSVVGLLNLPEPGITEAEWWNGTEFKKIECKLEAGALGVVNERGVSQIELNPAEAFGWDK